MAAAGASPSTSTESSTAPGRRPVMSRTTPVLSLIIGPIIAGIIGRMHPLERLLNLVALLLNSSRPLTFEEIRAKIPAYQQDDVASAKRMFERDKDALREVGVPV